jgi:hypothetical protein
MGAKRRMRLQIDLSGKLAWLLLACAWALALGTPLARANSVSQGNSWDSIKKLLDWSGYWEAVSYKKHMLGHGRAPYRDLSPPFNSRIEPKFQEYKKIAYAGGTFPSRADNCVSFGVPGDMDHPITTLQFLFTPGQVTLLAPSFFRVIHTDGRVHDHQFTTFQGDSIGRWENNGVLVVDTTDLDPGNEFILGLAQGKDSHVVERFHRRNDKALIDDVSFDAPEILDATYQYQVVFEHVTGPLVEFDCAQNNRDITPGGDKTFDITPPPQ